LYLDISNEEKNLLEIIANRYQKTHPLPEEYSASSSQNIFREKKEPNNSNSRRLKIVEDNGASKVDINERYLVDPSEFLTIYTGRMIDEAEESTGKFDNVTVTVPAAYGAHQREAIKYSVTEAIEPQQQVNMLTRPVAAAVILNDKQPSAEEDTFKLVFDITDGDSISIIV
jgi:molecular chaperone DnaK (HSP70)